MNPADRSKPVRPSPDRRAADADYRVGPGRPPRQYQFKPGQSGNPRGARRKSRWGAADLRALLEQALKEPVTIGHGKRARRVSKAAAGIARLVDQFAEGDRYARRDLLALADKLSIDLTAGRARSEEIFKTVAEIRVALESKGMSLQKLFSSSPPVAPPVPDDDDDDDSECDDA